MNEWAIPICGIIVGSEDLDAARHVSAVFSIESLFTGVLLLAAGALMCVPVFFRCSRVRSLGGSKADSGSCVV